MRKVTEFIEELREQVEIYEKTGNENTTACRLFRDSVEVIEAFAERFRWRDKEEKPEREMWCFVVCDEWGGDIVRVAVWMDGKWQQRATMLEFDDITKYVRYWMPMIMSPEDNDGSF